MPNFDDINLTPGARPLEDLISHYQAKNLLAYPEIIREVSPRLRNLSFKIPHEEIKRNVALLTVWPLVEAYKIAENSIATDISKDDKDNQKSLREKFYRLKESEDISVVTDRILKGDEWDVNYFNPNFVEKDEFLGKVLSVMCEPLKSHIDNTTNGKVKLLHDAQMGGSIYLIGEDKQIPNLNSAKYSFLMRSFICVNKDDHPTILIDNIEGGDPFFKKLDHWRGMDEEVVRKISENRIHQVYLALGSMRYMADILDIGTIIPRDYELTELSRMLGIREKRVFSKEQEQWKIGLHSKKKKTGVYTHSLYRGTEKNMEGTQLRYNVLQGFTYRNSSDMLNKLERLGENICNTNSTRTRSLAQRTNQRLDALNTMYELIEHYPLTTEQRRQDAKVIVLGVYKCLENFELAPPDRILPFLYKQ